MPFPLEIYQETTPNPDSLKFLFNKMLLPQEIFEAKNAAECSNSPLAKALFEKFSFITGVFISNNFITISKKGEETWYELMTDIKEFLRMYIGHGFEIVSASFLEGKMQERTAKDADNSIEDKIKGLLEKYVRPAVEMDGGNIAFKSFEDGIVTLHMQGSCSGCPSSQITLKSGIEGLLKRMVPEVTEVVAEAV